MIKAMQTANAVIPIDSILYGRGEMILYDEVVDYAIPGVELTSILGTGIRFLDPLEVYAPKRGTQINVANPASSFNVAYLYSSGLIFAVNQQKYDASYIITSLKFARDLFKYDTVCGITGNAMNDNCKEIAALKELCEQNNIIVSL